MIDSGLVEKNKSLAAYTSWQIGGVAENYSAPKNIEDLKRVMSLAREKGWSISVLGGGSNVLVSDKGVEGLLIHTHLLNTVKLIKQSDVVQIEALAGAQKSEVLKLFLKLRLAPAVFLAGLPGDMAGGVVMNAGVGHKVAPREFCEIIHSFDVLSYSQNGERPARGRGRSSRRRMRWARSC